MTSGGSGGKWWSISEPQKAWASLFHNIAFALAVAAVAPFSSVGLALLVASLLFQIWKWKKILENSLGTVAGVTTAMWSLQVSGCDQGKATSGSGPNIPLGIWIVAAEIILLLLVNSRQGYLEEQESLTQPPGES